MHRAGIRKILFLNSHGGQPQLLEIVCRDLRVKLGMFAVSVMWPRLIDMDELFDANENRHGIHGGQSETSVMLHLHPRPRRYGPRGKLCAAVGCRSSASPRCCGPEGAARFGWQAQDLHPKGACGDATRATAELGKTTVERAAARLLVLIDEISRYPLSRIAAGTAFDKPQPTRNQQELIDGVQCLQTFRSAKAFRISPADTNYFVMLFDKESDKIDNIFVIEIFKAGGATPPERARCRA